MNESIETVIVGGGQAGLAISYYLQQHRRPHVILEQAEQPGNAWRNDRWDSFVLNTPNWSFRLPGAEYDGPDPHGFMPREEIIRRFERYVETYRMPVRFGVQAEAVEPHNGGYRVRAGETDYQARNVVIATGLYQRPKVPPWSAGLPPELLQLTTADYRSPAQLPPGAVLVAGSGQTGCQIAEELYQSGRKVYLVVGSAGRAPRRYRGKDIIEWLLLSGFFDRPANTLPSPQARFAANPQISGRDGGHNLNLHRFAREGVTLLGRLVGAQGDTLLLAPNLAESLAKSDAFEANLLKMIDEYIDSAGLDAPAESVEQLRDGFDAPPCERLNLRAEGITSLIWTLGYTFDYSLVRLPVTDEAGFPVMERGVTAYPGLYFIGMPWLRGRKSGLLVGVGEDAEYVAAHIAGRAAA